MRAEVNKDSIFMKVFRYIADFIEHILIGVKYVFCDCFKDIIELMTTKNNQTRMQNIEDINIKKRINKKKYYKYIGIKDGVKVKGEILANNKVSLINFLAMEDIKVINVKVDIFKNFLDSIGFRQLKAMSNKDLIFWLTQVSTYLKAGITLNDTLKLMVEETKNDKMKNSIYRYLLYELTLGESFSSALASLSPVFPMILVNMIASAEASGDLIRVLDEMADYYTQIDKTRKEMLSAIIYPTLLLVFAIAVLTFIMLYVIPEFINVYNKAGIEVTGFTLTIVNISHFITTNINMIILGALIIVLSLLFLYKKNRKVKKAIQTIGMKIPFFGNIFIYHELTIFTKTFASLLHNSVDITTSFNILTNITNNEVYKDLMKETLHNIASGEKISKSFLNKWYVPRVAYYMISTGEQTGELALMMNKVAEYYSSLHESRIKNLKSFLEPIMIVILAIIVGIIILAVVIPMFSLYGQIR